MVRASQHRSPHLGQKGQKRGVYLSGFTILKASQDDFDLTQIMEQGYSPDGQSTQSHPNRRVTLTESNYLWSIALTMSNILGMGLGILKRLFLFDSESKPCIC